MDIYRVERIDTRRGPFNRCGFSDFRLWDNMRTHPTCDVTDHEASRRVGWPVEYRVDDMRSGCLSPRDLTWWFGFERVIEYLEKENYCIAVYEVPYAYGFAGLQVLFDPQYHEAPAERYPVRQLQAWIEDSTKGGAVMR